ncbi:MAG: SufE family protein [Flavobacteriales bacterium]|jgi:cysteine desulfuration protein SufE|tara:strand:+ start:62 stop:478 length:417 start_codon:yes stop_codon:yes gene_type:complete
MNTSISKIEKEIIAEFGLFDNWIDKYDYLIDLGKSLPKIDESEKTLENIISGCQSQVWLNAKKKDNNIVFTADSDAIMTKGIIAILIRVLSHQKPNDIINAKLDFIKTIGLNEQLSQTRANGLTSMIKKIKIYALALK